MKKNEASEVCKSVPLKELEMIEIEVHNALSPTVEFIDDIEVMRKKAKDQSEQSIYRILGWVKKYTNKLG